eukprot:2075287-Rhodomonas_salina.1
MSDTSVAYAPTRALCGARYAACGSTDIAYSLAHTAAFGAFGATVAPGVTASNATDNVPSVSPGAAVISSNRGKSFLSSYGR